MVKQFFAIVFSVVFLFILYRTYFGFVIVREGEVAIAYTYIDDTVKTYPKGVYFFWEGIIPNRLKVLYLPTKDIRIRYRISLLAPNSDLFDTKNGLETQLTITHNITFKKWAYKHYYSYYGSLGSLRNDIKQVLKNNISKQWFNIFNKKLPADIQPQIEAIYSTAVKQTRAYFAQEGIIIGKTAYSLDKKLDIPTYKKYLNRIDDIIKAQTQIAIMKMKEQEKEKAHKAQIRRVKELAKLARHNPTILKILYLETIKNKSKIVFTPTKGTKIEIK